jgi:hypothetical protein
MGLEQRAAMMDQRTPTVTAYLELGSCSAVPVRRILNPTRMTIVGRRRNVGIAMVSSEKLLGFGSHTVVSRLTRSELAFYIR